MSKNYFVNKILFSLIIIVLLLNFSFSQEYIYGIGIDFSSWTVERSTTTIRISKNEFLEKILDYFCNKYLCDDIEEETKNFFYEDIKKLSKMGFGNREIIRLILLKDRVPLTTKSLVPIGQLCLRKGSIKVVVEKFGLNYEKDIWLVSNDIYDKIISSE